MTKNQGGVVIALLCIVLAMQCGGLVVQEWGTSRVRVERDSYEYTTLFAPNISSDPQIRTYGSNGWEIVSARWARESDDRWGYECILRRVR